MTSKHTPAAKQKPDHEQKMRPAISPQAVDNPRRQENTPTMDDTYEDQDYPRYRRIYGSDLDDNPIDEEDLE